MGLHRNTKYAARLRIRPFCSRFEVRISIVSFRFVSCNLTNISSSTQQLDTAVINDLSAYLVLHPVAAILSAVATLFGFHAWIYNSQFGAIVMVITAVIAAVVTLIAFINDMVLWVTAQGRIGIVDSTGTFNSNAMLGNANWLTLAALLALIIGFCASGLEIQRKRRRSDSKAMGSIFWQVTI
jgi:hypothetical protein